MRTDLRAHKLEGLAQGSSLVQPTIRSKHVRCTCYVHRQMEGIVWALLVLVFGMIDLTLSSCMLTAG